MCQNIPTLSNFPPYNGYTKYHFLHDTNPCISILPGAFQLYSFISVGTSLTLYIQHHLLQVIFMKLVQHLLLLSSLVRWILRMQVEVFMLIELGSLCTRAEMTHLVHRW